MVALKTFNNQITDSIIPSNINIFKMLVKVNK